MLHSFEAGVLQSEVGEEVMVIEAEKSIPLNRGWGDEEDEFDGLEDEIGTEYVPDEEDLLCIQDEDSDESEEVWNDDEDQEEE